MEPVLQDLKFNSPIDIEVGPDGRLYVLEYGTGWFTKNDDAALSRIDFNYGNRAPKAFVQVDKTSGSVPLTVKLSADESMDADRDKVSYVWHYGNSVKETKEPKTTITLSTAGEYSVYVEVKDDKGAKGKSTPVNVYAGNEAPNVKIETGTTTLAAGQPVSYKVLVSDKEDGNKIDPDRLFVNVNYISGMDKAQVVGHQGVSTIMEGKAIMASLDCIACHRVDERSIGPGYIEVSKKYAKDKKANEYLAGKIIKGGSGVWGEVPMAAHPDLKPADADKIVTWIMSLSKPEQKTLPAEGSVTPTEKDVQGGKLMQISATYLDKGGVNRKALTGSNSVIIKAPETKK
jgi:cytochrome c551/c552